MMEELTPEELEEIEDSWREPEPPEPIEDDPQFPRGTTVSVDGYGGVAFYVRHVLGDRVVCVMVGDDREHAIHREDIHLLAREEFCGVCGQLGCTHDGYDREDN